MVRLAAAVSLLSRVRKAKHRSELALFRRRYDWDRAAPRSEQTLIVFYNGMWGRPPVLPPEGLPEGCEVTADRRRLREAAAVVFHIPSLGSLNGVRKFPGQFWVAQSLECPAHQPRLRDPSFMSRFDLTMTYARDADVVMPYYGPGLEERLRTPPREKTGFATFFASGRHDLSGRVAYAAELMRHMEVHSYGRRLRNKKLRPDRGRESKLDATAGYRFTLAFENASAIDYVTEKFFDPLIMGSVPVYLGAPNVDEFAPADHCYIDASHFSGPEALARHLTGLTAEAYGEYLAWKQRPLRASFLELVEEQRTPPLARLCERVRELHG